MTQDLSDCVSRYDLVFNVGVIEHYLKESERREFLRRKLALCKSGGYIVSVVPSGVHPYREEQKQEGWGGYNVPEVDYSPELLATEMREVGAQRVMVLPHNAFGYLLTRSPKRRWFRYVGLQLLTPLLPLRVMCRCAYSFIAIGQKQ